MTIEKMRVKAYRCGLNPMITVLVPASHAEPLSLTPLADLALGKYTFFKEFELSRLDKGRIALDAGEALDEIEKNGFYLSKLSLEISRT